VKLLFDQNLSPRLVATLADLFPESAHVQSLGLDCSPDTSLWEFARDNDFVIVSKDVDFCDRSALLGYPPKVVWIRLGNCTTDDIDAALRSYHEQIEAFGEEKELGVITIF
jgi:predicted nuclease of predicted toxin-antitoxin system